MLPIIILSGGLATRLYPKTQTIPKSLLDICGRPFIAHQLDLLKSKGVVDIIICAGFLGDMIKSFLDENDFGLNISYSFDTDKLLGTGGAIKKALSKFNIDSFFVLYGDSYLDVDYLDIENVFKESKKSALMSVYKNDGQFDKSNVVFREGNIIKYSKIEKDENMHYIDYGLGIFNRRIFETENREAFDLAQIYQNQIANNDIAAYEIFKRFYEIGSFKGIEDFTKFIESKNETNN
jgi:NDP-sugar pyrophosphorylase family protein